ncbi:unnamed protein product, partial [Medioppia subpectinata]
MSANTNTSTSELTCDGQTKRIGIIGAGISGIAAVKACLERGLDNIVVYERTDSSGGLWRYRDEDREGNAMIMKTLVCNTSKEMTAFSDIPPPDDYPNYMPNHYMAKYLDTCAERINFNTHTKYLHEVVTCEQNTDYTDTGRWRLTVRCLATGRQFVDVCDGVMVCTGLNNRPVMPEFKDQSLFKGEIIHSRDYRKPGPYEGKRVVVVGIGNSGGDVAVELSTVAEKVYLSTRSGSWVLRRVGLSGRPFDGQFNRRSMQTLLSLTPYPIQCYFGEMYVNTKFNHKLYDLKPKHRLFAQHPMVNDDLPNRVLAGYVCVKPNIDRFTENGVVFEGESDETACDTIVMATGYELNYPFLSADTLCISKSDFKLYKHVFYPHHRHPHTLAIIGCVQPGGSIPPIAELQCRWFARLMADSGHKLPSEAKMVRDVRRRHRWVERRFFSASRHSLEEDWVPYMDQLAREVGVKPSLVKYFFTDPRLWWNLFFGPCLPYQYRLNVPKKIAIIGAGNSGMGAFNACREQGFHCVVYEKTDQLCGLWRYRDEELEGSASIMKSTTINTSKEMTPFSTFPAPKHFPNYMHNTKMAEYLSLYADKIGIRDHVKLRHEIIDCQQNTDYEETGRWRLTVRDIDNDRVFDQVFDGVMVCTGHNNKPSMPTFKNQHLFKGRVMHAHAFKDNTGFDGQRVVVVGIGNSGGDVAVELSHVCPKVYLSTRTGSWVCYRVGHGGRPFDSMLLRRWVNTMFNFWPFGLVSSVSEGYLNMRFNHKLYGLKPKHRVYSQHIFVNDDLPKRIMSGCVVVKGDIEQFTENGVIFHGDSCETRCDAVVMATGYEISYPFLTRAGFTVDKKDFNLYKNIFSPELKHPHTMAFIGLVLPIGAVLPCAELQSRYFALLMANKVKMPTHQQMIKDNKRRRVWLKQHFPNWQKYSLEVYYIKYLDELATLMGVKPKLFKYFFTDPKLWSHLYFGPCVPYQYRLNGPNAWPEARQTILTVKERIDAPFNSRN